MRRSATGTVHVRQHGFSLLEVVVCVAIAGALLATTYPRLATMVSGARLDGAARTLALELQKTRLRAIAEGKCFQVSFNATARTLQIANKAGVTPCGTTGFTNDGAARKLDDSGAIAVSATASPVFDTRGNGSTTAVITLTALDGSVRLAAVNAVGRVNVQ
jgi:prepilin-type N-terminal cleavage/methylation domain-containing protein